MSQFKFIRSLKFNAFNCKEELTTAQFINIVFGSSATGISHASQYENNKTFLVTFADTDYGLKTFQHYAAIINRTLTSDKADFRVIDPNKILDFYRVCWLPHGFGVDRVKKYFEKFGFSGISVEEEFMKEEGLHFIKNGNYKVTVTRSEKTINKGIQKIDGFESFIYKIGEPLNCFLCNSAEHLRKDCPKRLLKCEKCKKAGHLFTECSFAKISAASNIEKPNIEEAKEEVIVIEKEKREKKEENNKIKSTEKKNNNTNKANKNKENQAQKLNSNKAASNQSTKRGFEEIRESKTSPNEKNKKKNEESEESEDESESNDDTDESLKKN